jgi:hypothetical protein
VHGTVENFREVLERERPGAIHFSGHGLSADQIRQQNRDNNMSEEEIQTIYQKGDAIIMEDKLCLG